MAKEAQSHRVSKTPTASAGHKDMLQGSSRRHRPRDAASSVEHGGNNAASSVEHGGNNKGGRVLFARSRILCAPVSLWPTPVDCGRNRG